MIKAFASDATIVAGGFSGLIQPNGTAVSIALLPCRAQPTCCLSPLLLAPRLSF